MDKPLDGRLTSVAALVLSVISGRRCPRVADIGCDHGYLSAWLLESVPDLTLLASDVSAPSLIKAKRRLSERGLTARARFAVADGLSALDGPFDAIVIAGMGAATILQIVRDGREKIGDAALIVQANLNLPQLRAGLAKLGFTVEREAYSRAAGRHYCAMLARASNTRRCLSEREALLGFAVDGMRESDQRDYFLWLRGVRTKEAEKVARLCARSASARGRILRNMQEIQWIEEAMKMRTCTVKDIEASLEEIAPRELAEEWDNVGLLVGRGKNEVSRVLVALDVTREVIDEAKALGVQAIVTHHPMMFHARKQITDADREGRLLLDLAREDMALIAAHTNLDAAPGGVNDTLMRVMGCKDVRGEGCVRVGELVEGMTFGALCEQAQKALHTTVRTYGSPDRPVKRLGCCSGAGGGELPLAKMWGADCFITGEIRHHEALEATDEGICVIEAGHYETENPICEVLRTALQNKLDALEYQVTVFCSKVNPFGR